MPLSPTVGSSCSLRRCDVEDFGPYDDGRHRHLLDGRPGEAFDVKRVQANARRGRGRLYDHLRPDDTSRRPTHR